MSPISNQAWTIYRTNENISILSLFFLIEYCWNFEKKIPNLNQHLSLFTTFTVPFIGEIISPIDVSTSPVVKDQTDRGLNWYLLHLAAMLKNSRKALAKLTCRFSSDSLKSSLSINLKTASNNPSAWSSENLFISNRIAQGRPTVFCKDCQAPSRVFDQFFHWRL